MRYQNFLLAGNSGHIYGQISLVTFFVSSYYGRATAVESKLGRFAAAAAEKLPEKLESRAVLNFWREKEEEEGLKGGRPPPSELSAEGDFGRGGIDVNGAACVPRGQGGSEPEPHGQGGSEPEPPHGVGDQGQVREPLGPVLGRGEAPEGCNWACK